MSRDVRLAVGYVAAITALGALINATAMVMHARPMEFTNDGHYRTTAPEAGRNRVGTGRRHHAARDPGVRHHRLADPRPRAWCGWWMRQQLGMRDTALNLARNWQHVGRPSSPAPGVIVVWRHHVGRIVAVTGRGKAIVESGNDGGAVRRRERSISNAIAFREV
jgi:hypothetical protein